MPLVLRHTKMPLLANNIRLLMVARKTGQVVSPIAGQSCAGKVTLVLQFMITFPQSLSSFVNVPGCFERVTVW